MKRLGCLLTALAATVVPAGVASAAADVTDSVRTLATQAAEAVAEEHALLDASTDPTITASDLATLEDRISTVDARGAELLVQLDRLDVDLTQAIRVGLGTLPRPLVGENASVLLPPDAVYDAAVADLTRVAETPGAVTHTPNTSNSPGVGLLAVAALSLLALGAAALGNSLRRRPDDELLAAMAWSDGLTGLANRRRFEADIETHGDGPTAAIMIDIDHFKSINDSFGHALGDEVLQQVSERLSRHVRFDDVVYRCGGEEFCILLHDATAGDARDIADRIVEAVRGIELPDGRNVTVSVGVAGDADAATVVRRADEALYAAKEHGRDRAISSDDQPVAI